MKIASNVPVPPPLTAEDRAKLERESREWAEGMRERIRAMENITPDEWRTVVR